MSVQKRFVKSAESIINKIPVANPLRSTYTAYSIGVSNRRGGRDVETIPFASPTPPKKRKAPKSGNNKKKSTTNSKRKAKRSTTAGGGVKQKRKQSISKRQLRGIDHPVF